MLRKEREECANRVPHARQYIAVSLPGFLAIPDKSLRGRGETALLHSKATYEGQQSCIQQLDHQRLAASNISSEALCKRRYCGSRFP